MKLPWTILSYILVTGLTPALSQSQRNAVITLPALTGKYGIGTTVLPLIDSSRPETITELIPDDVREIMVRIWYPADTGASGDTLEYVDSITEHFLVQKDSFPSGFFSTIKTHAIKNIPVAGGSEKFPVLLFSPGLGCICQLYQAFIEDLVSHGYIVAGMNHPYFANIAVFPDGHFMEYGFDSLDNPAEHFHVVVDDAKFVIARLKYINDSLHSHTLFRRMNLENTGMYGHSFGGAASVETALQAPVVKAGVNIDGTLFGTSHLTLFDDPVYIMVNENHQTDFTIDSAWHYLTGDGFRAVVKKSRHFSFMDLILYPENALPGRFLQEIGTIDSIALVQFTLKSLLAFFNCYLKSDSRDSILAVAKQYDEVVLQLSDAIGVIDLDPSNTSSRGVILTNQPNPFKHRTTFHFNLPANRKAVLKIGTIKGQQVDIVDVTSMKSLCWMPKSPAGGVYICTLLVDGAPESAAYRFKIIRLR